MAYDARRAPLLLALPAVLAGSAMLLPLLYLVIRAGGVDPGELAALVLRPKTLVYLGNTLSLVGCVLALTTLIALPLALIVVRSDLGFSRLLTLLAVLPLAIPGYVMAYALIGLSGYYGPLSVFFGLRLPRPEGLFGATLALGLYTFPYLFLTLRSALVGMDPALVESARSLGRAPLAVFWRVTLPHLKPALLSGWLIIALYTIGDFGAIALMRFEVFSAAIYSQYANAFEVHYAAWLSLMLIGIAGAILLVETRLSRGTRVVRSGQGARRLLAPMKLGRWKPLAVLFVAAVALASLGVPALVILFWLTRAPTEIDWAAIPSAAWQTLAIAGPVALVAVAIALPVALFHLRHPGRTSFAVERLTWFGYAMPPLPFALSVAFLSLAALPGLYQSLPLLVAALAVHLAAVALGPIRSRLVQIGPRTEEAARALGRSSAAAFAFITLPLVARSLVAGGVLVFMAAAKELPLTLLLSPIGTRTMAMSIFSRTSEGALYDAAPYAALTILFSGLVVGLILRYEGAPRS
ncbi:ABC transporter permease [Aureimonas glaciei]|uniref:ABC transporter permease n=2 Tax=Aureimonas glaciei TaxID=1776957 RepID=A0A917D9V9_9HYPH|nr:ABC transporter permease [Aureimonas glaciei]